MKYLRQGHFLPIKDRTDFKITLMAFKAMFSQGPKYLDRTWWLLRTLIPCMLSVTSLTPTSCHIQTFDRGCDLCTDTSSIDLTIA